MMNKYILFFVLFFALQYLRAEEEDSLVFFFWNVENLFHPEDDSTTLDDEFTPEGDRHWSWYRYYAKTARIWKTIIAAGNTRPPPVICLAEIENAQVLKDLFVFSPPGKYGYEIIHKESDDRRGIDVGILYDPERISLIRSRWIRVNLEEIGGGPTRDILFACFQWKNDNFCLFLNHWPSKYGGAGITEKYRMKASATLVNELKSVNADFPELKIICLGDFNDTRESFSHKFLEKEGDMCPLSFRSGEIGGTLKYQGTWQFIDHVFVSRNLLDPGRGMRVKNCRIFSPSFLLEPDLKYGGRKPYRTWYGFTYREGFSDHLPVMLTLSF